MKAETRLRSALATVVIAVASTTTTVDSLAGPTISDQASTASLIDPAALARAQQKVTSAQQIADRFSAEAQAQALPEQWRSDLINKLMQSDAQGLAQAQSATTLGQARQSALEGMQRKKNSAVPIDSSESTAAVASQPKLLGDTDADLVYVPITPCRILDTRSSSPITGGTSRTFNFDTSNSGAGSCSVDSQIPGGALFPAAEAANVTVVQAGLGTIPAGSFISVSPEGGATSTSWMNYNTGDIKANAGVISINQSNGEFSIFAQSTTNVVVDVFGLFLPPQATALDCFDTTKVQATLPALGSIIVTSSSCPAGYTVTGGSCFGGDANGSIYLQESSLNADNQWHCQWQSKNGGDQNVATTSHCCRVPGR